MSVTEHTVSGLGTDEVDSIAEWALIGSLLSASSGRDVPAVMAGCPPLLDSDFAATIPRAAWGCIVGAAAADGFVDFANVVDEAKRRGVIDVVTAHGLARAIGLGTIVSDAPAYARRVLEGSVVRQARRELAEAGAEPTSADIDAALERVQAEVLTRARVSDQIGGNSLKALVAEVARQWRAQREGRILGIPSGVFALDHQIGGLPESVTILAARPGMGKSSLARQIALHNATEGDVLYLGLEEPEADVLLRMALGHSELSYSAARRKPLPPEAMDRAMRPFESGAFKLHIHHPRPATPENVGATLRVYAMRHKLRLVIVDHLSCMHGAWKGESPYAFATRAARAVVGAAQAATVPVILVAQLNRECEKRENKRPVMSDLRDTGELEQLGALILFCYRHAVYEQSHDPREAEIIASKNRNGACGTVKLLWDGPRMWFGDRIVSDVDDDNAAATPAF